jgi:lipopolysaccharide export system protein LptC
MAVARTQTFDQRAAILDRLIWRNRIVGFLRIGVPAVGVFAFILLVGQIWLASIAKQYGVSGIRIDRGNLVVETPQYAGIGADGSRYLINASEARSPLDNANIINMTDAAIVFAKPSGSAFHAKAAAASMDTNRQFVTIPGITNFHTDDGMHGTLTEVRSDQRANVLTAEGPVDITFSDGTKLQAAKMHFDGNTALWTFSQATLVVADLPKSPIPPIPFFTSDWVMQ